MGCSGGTPLHPFLLGTGWGWGTKLGSRHKRGQWPWLWVRHCGARRVGFTLWGDHKGGGGGRELGHPPPSAMGSHHTETRGPRTDASPIPLQIWGGPTSNPTSWLRMCTVHREGLHNVGPQLPQQPPLSRTPSPGHGDPRNPPALILSTVLSAGFGIPLCLSCSLEKETQLCHSPPDTELGDGGNCTFHKALGHPAMSTLYITVVICLIFFMVLPGGELCFRFRWRGQKGDLNPCEKK